MADGRMLAKKISLNEAVASLENDMHRLLFTWGLSHLDIEGRISGSPKVFRAMVVPLLEHITSEKIAKFFKDAVDKGLIVRYQIGKDWFIQYPKFKDNQRLRPDREAVSKIPAYDGELPEDSGTTPGVNPEDSGTTPGVNPEDSGLILSKDKLSLNQDKLREDTRNRPPKKSETPLPEDFGVSEAVRTWAVGKGFDRLEDHLESFKDYALSRGKTYADWDSAFKRAIREDWAKLKNNGGLMRPPGQTMSKADQVTAGNLAARERLIKKYQEKGE